MKALCGWFWMITLFLNYLQLCLHSKKDRLIVSVELVKVCCCKNLLNLSSWFANVVCMLHFHCGSPGGSAPLFQPQSPCLTQSLQACCSLGTQGWDIQHWQLKASAVRFLITLSWSQLVLGLCLTSRGPGSEFFYIPKVKENCIMLNISNIYHTKSFIGWNRSASDFLLAQVRL